MHIHLRLYIKTCQKDLDVSWIGFFLFCNDYGYALVKNVNHNQCRSWILEVNNKTKK